MRYQFFRGFLTPHLATIAHERQGNFHKIEQKSVLGKVGARIDYAACQEASSRLSTSNRSEYE